MSFASRKFGTFLAIAGLSAFLLIHLFGADSAFNMEVRKDGTMSGCLFDGKAEICTMSFSQHLSSWQGMFAATTPEKINALALLALIAVLFTAVAALRQHVASLLNYYANRWRFYIKQSSSLAIFNPLQEAFSQGILNPKIYNIAN